MGTRLPSRYALRELSEIEYGLEVGVKGGQEQVVGLLHATDRCLGGAQALIGASLLAQPGGTGVLHHRCQKFLDSGELLRSMMPRYLRAGAA
jgi:hypothetical protein